HDDIRPLVRAARKPIPDLKKAAGKLSKTAPGLTTIGRKLNVLGNMAAYNPRGAEGCSGPDNEAPGFCPPGRDEGYLYWAAWLGHNSTSIFQAQDGNGLYRRIYFTAGCEELLNILTGSPAGAPVAGIVTGLGPLFAPGGACD
ncbi:MAG: hypothetical protein M3331_06425, partial [Actinomycetota bacterium]|nr:hypothetical protein [Actinomycetota bacterium]